MVPFSFYSLFRKSSEKSSEGDSYYLQKGHFKHGKNFEEVLRSKNNSRHSESGTSIRFKRSDNGDLKIVADAESNETACRFEITIFEYKGVIERPPTLPPGASPYVPAGESHVGNIALIIPSQMLPELERDNIRKFMDGKMAIQLQARVPGSPIQFILPSGKFHSYHVIMYTIQLETFTSENFHAFPPSAKDFPYSKAQPTFPNCNPLILCEILYFC